MSPWNNQGSLNRLHHRHQAIHNRIAFLILAAIAVSNIHEVAGTSFEMRFPLFHGYEVNGKWWNGHVYFDRWVYDVGEGLGKVLMGGAVYCAIPSRFILIYICVEFADIIDYILIYNYTWFTFSGIKIEFDKVKIGLILIFAIIETWTHRQFIGSSD